MRIACVGEAMIELSMAEDIARVGVAGDTLNTAIYLKRAAPALEVDYVTCLGDDPFSHRIKDFIAEANIGTGAITHLPGHSPGLYAITTDGAGERAFTYWRGQSAARRLFADGQCDILDDYHAIYLSGISLAILSAPARTALMTYLEGCAATIIYDSNYRPNLWEDADTARAVNDRLWARADIALPSIDDEMALYGEDAAAVAARFAARGRIGALKRGAQGPMSLAAAVSQEYPAAPQVVDTTAAGDSFNGGYIAAHLSGADQAAALMAGHLCACHVVQHRGAIVPPAIG